MTYTYPKYKKINVPPPREDVFVYQLSNFINGEIIECADLLPILKRIASDYTHPLDAIFPMHEYSLMLVRKHAEL